MEFEIGELHPNTPHLFADLVELLLLSGYIGRKTLHKNDLLGLLENGTISPEELDQEYDFSEEAENTDLSSAEINSRRDRQLEDIFSQLTYRSHALQNHYPFKLNDDELILISKNQLNESQRVYPLLLACSRLRSFKQAGTQQKWAKAFAELSKLAMKGLMPKHASVHIFDANSEDRRNYYSTNLKIALEILGDNLSAKVDHAECQKASTSGDAGLDLVAFINFDDGAATSYAMLAQCGAQEINWPQKKLEAHPFNYRPYFNSLIDYPSAMFTPICYRNSTGEWVKSQDASGSLLIDRGRIMALLEKQNCWDNIISESWFQEFETAFKSINNN